MGFKILVSGDYACYTRPEMKVERVSYDVPTPCALEGMIKSIYWKPAIRFVIDKIVVYNPVNFINIRRNEIEKKLSYSKVKSQMKNKTNALDIFASDLRTQRAGMILKDVKYGVEFHFEMTGLKSEHDDESEEKHYNILLRRLKKGQTFRQPCLGCREFSVKSIELVDDFNLEDISSELSGTVDLGYMLYGLKFEDNGVPLNNSWEFPEFSDNADALFYRPLMVDGVIDVRKYGEEVRC